MWVGIREMGRLLALRWPELAAGAGAAGALWLLGFRMQLRAGQRRREQRIEEELAAYARLDVRRRWMAMRLRTGQAGEPVDGGEERVSQGGDAGTGCGGTAFGRGQCGDGRRRRLQLLNAWGEGVAVEERSGGTRFDGGMAAWECVWGEEFCGGSG